MALKFVINQVYKDLLRWVSLISEVMEVPLDLKTDEGKKERKVGSNAPSPAITCLHSTRMYTSAYRMTLAMARLLGNTRKMTWQPQKLLDNSLSIRSGTRNRFTETA
ncbi:hypothetical protein M408DRAFT_30989 [Serendipita vermifera MAFF 305830]|uniref:Uncharacterized protein n=1 Tax=Serendipita vermifera MAFF 305830 TaxID=933852 RepID=A0A0C3AK92_SERVB|nr:hypothetical protein M408DRAFT_30989 [Serendipita vermifera MAFF 305830]